ncbi:MAG: 16S rRNA (cytosine(1402)-N(4))-methyltransferase RsmH [Chlamydiota bacterium]
MSLLHTPVLQEEILQYLSTKGLRTFCDATLGNGGHALALLEAHPEIEIYLGLDQDKHALGIARKHLTGKDKKIHFLHRNFRHIEQIVQEKGFAPFDGILFDLGVSSMQLDEQGEGFEQRGFSFLRPAPLDMRMNQDQPLTAEQVINDYSEKQLGEIFRELGEEPFWRSIARTIHQARQKKRITTTTELVDLVERVKKRRGRLHPATLVFQALRILVNEELISLEEGLRNVIPLLAKGGLLFVISFHSLEDRIAKQVFRAEAKVDASLRILTKKPLIATRAETRKNPRARSAKMRILERSADHT